jgi:hypothetical protein
MLTNEQVAAMSKEQLVAANFRDVWGSIQDMEYTTAFKDDYARIMALFEQPTSHWAQRIRTAFDKRDEEGVAALVPVFAREPALVQILTWSRMTNCGIDEIDYAKFVHRHFAAAILALFGEVIAEKDRGVIPPPPVFKKA